MKRRVIPENPFAEVDRSVRDNPDRQRFISREVISRVIDAAPSAEWRLLIALARFAGLRTPSEPFSLKWDDIDWAAGKMWVTAPKTAHHHGKDRRLIPIFPEVLPYLEDVRETVPAEAEYVLHVLRQRASMDSGNWQAVNLRTTLLKVIKRAGEQSWPRLWHNLRSSCQTELTERFPAHVVCAWLGNSEAVARRHYLQVTDEHFATAAKATQNPTQSATAMRRITSPAATADAGSPCFAGISDQSMSVRGLEPRTYGLKV